MSRTSFTIAVSMFSSLFLAGCKAATPLAGLPVRDAQYYTAHPSEMPMMQKICDQWKGSEVSRASLPSVIVNNCNAVLDVREQAKRQAALRYYRGQK